MDRRTVLAVLAVSATFLGVAAPVVANDPPKEVRLDYAYYSPPSLVIRKFGWMEEAFKPGGTSVRWVLSQGSNRALEFLNANSVDFGSTAGLAAVLAKANGNPIKAVYVYSRPEWTALVVPKDSPIKSIADLKGKKIAATKGTDPYLFLLRTLGEGKLSKSDITHVHLQHADGRAALERGQVDAWAGLDPHMAAAQIDGGARLLYRNVEYNTYGLLNVREAFLAQHPQATGRVLEVYERARKWIIANPDETARIVAEEAKINTEVARLQLKRNDFTGSAPGPAHIAALKAAAPLLLEEGLVKPGTDVGKVVDSLIERRVARSASSVPPLAEAPAQHYPR